MKLQEKKPHRSQHWSLVIGHWSFLLLLTGCSTWDISSKLPWASSEQKLKEEKFQRPVRMVAIWTPTTISAPGKPTTRGLGGRLYFYNDEGETIPVQGQLIVYAYDDSARKQNVSHVKGTGGVDEPDRKFAFTPEQFTNHFSPTDLGASYSVWIPWGPIEGPPVKVSLVPVFTSSNGNVVMAQASRNVLKGTVPAILDDNGQESTALPDDGVVQIQQRTKETELRTTTIPISEVTAERIKRAGEMPLPQPGVNLPQNAVVPNATQPATNPAAISAPANQPRATNASGRGVPPPWMPHQPPPARFEPPKFPVPEGPAPQPTFDRDPTPPSPSAPQYAPPSTPESNSPFPGRAASSGEPQTRGPGW
jgi:hypothetical protein